MYKQETLLMSTKEINQIEKSKLAHYIANNVTDPELLNEWNAILNKLSVLAQKSKGDEIVDNAYQHKINKYSVETLLACSPQVYCLIDRNYRIVDFNKVAKQYCNILLNKEICKNASIFSYLTEENSALKENLQKAFKGEVITKEKELKTRKKAYRFQITYYPVVDNNQVVAVGFHMLDITKLPHSNEIIQLQFAEIEDKNKELSQSYKEIKDMNSILEETSERLKYSEKKYRMLFNSMIDCFLLFEVLYNSKNQPIDYKVIEANPAFEKLSGKRINFIRNKHILEIFPSIKSSWLQTANQVVTTGKPYQTDFYSDSFHRYLRAIFLVPQPRQLAVIFSDIDQRKRTEQALIESEATARGLLNSPDYSIILIDTNGIILDLNQKAMLRYGKNKAELLNRSFYEIIPIMRSIAIKKRVNKLMKHKTPIVNEFSVGDNYYVQKFYPIFDQQGNVIKISIFINDITNRKLAELQMKENEQKYKLLFENMLNGFAVVEIIYDAMQNPEDARFYIINKSFEKQFRKRKQHVIGRTVGEVLPELNAFFQNIINSVLDFKKQTVECYYEKVNRYFDGLGYLVNKNQVAILIRDISERKKNEITLRRSENLYNTTTNSISDYIFVIDKDLKILLMNQKLLLTNQEFDLSTDVIGISLAKVYPFISKRILREYKKIFKTGKSDETETMFSIKERSFFIYLKRIPVVEKGEVVRIVTVISDITQRKKVEEQLYMHREELRLQNIDLRNSQQELEKSRKRYIDLYNFAPNSYFTLNHLSNILELNIAAGKMLGANMDLLINKAFITFVSKECKHNFFVHIKDVFESDDPNLLFEEEITLQNAIGKIYHLQVQSVLFYDAENDENLCRSAMIDITEQKRAQNAIKQSEEKFRNIIQQSGDGVMLIDNDGCIVEWNQGQEQITGLKKRDVINKYFWDVQYELLPKNFRNSGTYFTIKSQITEGLQEGKTNRFYKPTDKEIVSKNNRRKHIQSILFPIKTDQGFMLASIERDITELKRTESELRQHIVKLDITQREMARKQQQLEEANRKMQETEKILKRKTREAQDANRSKSEFLANMSHEIRTPMNAILGFAEILKDKLSDDLQYTDYIYGIQTSGKNLLSLINDILDLSKIEAGRLNLQYSTFNIYGVIEEIKNILSIRTKKKNILFDFVIDVNLPKLIKYDETRLKQILFNLIGNAVKFTDEGFVKTVFVVDNKRFVMQEDSPPLELIDLTIKIHDSGIGVPKEEQKIIFQPFRQREGQSDRKYGGTGLGLNITKRLVEMMKGTITLESQVNVGSTFTVELKNIEVPTTNTLEKEEDKSTQQKIQFKNSNILLVEDLESNRLVVRGFLADCNVNVHEVQNGKEALDVLKEKKFDLIIMDLHMPIMNGYEATEKIRNPGSNGLPAQVKKTPILAITATQLRRDREAKKGFFDAYIRKPVTNKQLIAELSRFLPHLSESDKKTTIAKKPKQAIQKTANLSIEYPPQVKQIFHDELLPLFHQIEKRSSIKTIKRFAKQIIQCGEDHKIQNIIDYGNELYKHVNSFNITKIDKTLNEFSTFATEITTGKPTTTDNNSNNEA